MIIIKKISLALFLLFMTSFAIAAEIKIPIHLSSDNKYIGDVIAQDSPYGLLLQPHLTGLPPGVHGFHIHETADCSNHGEAAGGHLDPQHTGKHLGPYNTDGHLGDLPVLIVNADGAASLPVLAPRLTTQLIQGHSLMLHAGGDNYADQPAKLGGGGNRLACGIIK